MIEGLTPLLRTLHIDVHRISLDPDSFVEQRTGQLSKDFFEHCYHFRGDFRAFRDFRRVLDFLWDF